MGTTVEEQAAAEEAEFESFFQVQNEFKSETDGPVTDVQDDLEDFYPFVELFLLFKKQKASKALEEINNINIKRILRSDGKVGDNDDTFIPTLLRDRQRSKIELFLLNFSYLKLIFLNATDLTVPLQTNHIN